MAKRSNYTYEKRQKELRKQKKREAKAEKKRLRKEAAAAGLDGLEGLDNEELQAAIDRARTLEEGHLEAGDPDADWDEDGD